MDKIEALDLLVKHNRLCERSDHLKQCLEEVEKKKSEMIEQIFVYVIGSRM